MSYRYINCYKDSGNRVLKDYKGHQSHDNCNKIASDNKKKNILESTLAVNIG